MVIEVFAWVFDLTFQLVFSLILPALQYILLQIVYLISLLLPTLYWIITQSISIALSWLLPALGWILEQAIAFLWQYPVVIITTILCAILSLVLSPFILLGMGFTSVGILANSFGAWMMSVVYASGWGLPLLSSLQSAGALGAISGWFGAVGGAIGFVLSYIYSLFF